MAKNKMNKPRQKTLSIWHIGLIGIGLIILFLFSALRFWQAEKAPQGKTDLAFRAVELPFTHQADLVNSLPFLASAALDIDGDGQDELFLGGGAKQADKLFNYTLEGFSPLPITFEKEPIDATHGAASIDIDNDGDTDLFVARESGIWLYKNTNGKFSGRKLPLNLADNTVPLSIALADINKDGLADIYISGYLNIGLVEGQTIFADGYGGYSYLFLNEGNGNWRDITKSSGLWRQHNTFTAVFADLDNDGDSDLVIAQDTGKVEMYENNNDLTFSSISNPSDYSYPMGVAAGDYDNDGLIDLYFSNVGYTMPPMLLRGGLGKDDEFNPAYMLFHNDGRLQFSDTSAAKNAARYGFGWGTVFADMNLDGREDLLAAQNYARLPGNAIMARYPGKILQNNGDKFDPVEIIAGAQNNRFGIAPIVSDFNQDGWLDLVWANLDGPSLAYINKAGERNWTKVRLPNTARSLNARITVMDSSGLKQTKQLISSQGLGSDQGRDLIFGIGIADSIVQITAIFQNGVVRKIENPTVKTTVHISAEAPIK